jgi:hypothetical protein
MNAGIYGQAEVFFSPNTSGDAKASQHFRLVKLDRQEQILLKN